MSRRDQNVMQAYWVDVAPDKIGRAKPGQFVHMNDRDDRVCGFIGQVDQAGKRVMIYLFEPVPVKPTASASTATASRWADRQDRKTLWNGKTRAATSAVTPCANRPVGRLKTLITCCG